MFYSVFTNGKTQIQTTNLFPDSQPVNLRSREPREAPDRSRSPRGDRDRLRPLPAARAKTGQQRSPGGRPPPPPSQNNSPKGKKGKGGGQKVTETQKKFNKRKASLLRKATELSLLCDINIFISLA